jgi:transcriptional regulator with XRE-family HTH domain
MKLILRRRHLLSRALIDLRRCLGETQEHFAHRLGTTVRSISRYESSRVPTGKILSQLELIARTAGHDEYADLFRSALVKELGYGSVSGAAKERRSPWRLFGRDELMAAYDEHVGQINRDGDTVHAIRMEFDRSDGTTLVADISPPEFQSVTKNAKTVRLRVPPPRRPGDHSSYVVQEVKVAKARKKKSLSKPPSHVE